VGADQTNMSKYFLPSVVFAAVVLSFVCVTVANAQVLIPQDPVIVSETGVTPNGSYVGSDGAWVMFQPDGTFEGSRGWLGLTWGTLSVPGTWVIFGVPYPGSGDCEYDGSHTLEACLAVTSQTPFYFEVGEPAPPTPSGGGNLYYVYYYYNTLLWPKFLIATIVTAFLIGMFLRNLPR